MTKPKTFIKDCWICKEHNIHVRFWSGYFVECKSCGTRTHAFRFRRDAINAWNKKNYMKLQQHEIEELLSLS